MEPAVTSAARTPLMAAGHTTSRNVLGGGGRQCSPFVVSKSRLFVSLAGEASRNDVVAIWIPPKKWIRPTPHELTLLTASRDSKWPRNNAPRERLCGFSRGESGILPTRRRTCDPPTPQEPTSHVLTSRRHVRHVRHVRRVRVASALSRALLSVRWHSHGPRTSAGWSYGVVSFAGSRTATSGSA